MIASAFVREPLGLKQHHLPNDAVAEIGEDIAICLITSDRRRVGRPAAKRAAVGPTAWPVAARATRPGPAWEGGSWPRRLTDLAQDWDRRMASASCCVRCRASVLNGIQTHSFVDLFQCRLRQLFP